MAHSTIDGSAGASGWRDDAQVLRGLVTVNIVFTLATAATGAEEHRDLPIPPWGFGLIALGVFFVLFLITWAFRSVGNRH